MALKASRRYVLITPCRNESKFIRRTLDSTCSQSVPPALWVIVDDGSTDGTLQILKEYANRFSFIEIVEKPDRGNRAVGPGVIEAFYYGLRRVDLSSFDYIAKFDGDLEIPNRYFERVMEKMEQDPYLGNLSGKLYERLESGKLLEERTGNENAVGPIKFYRMKCFLDIGGFVREVAWDGIDGHICRMNGWIAKSEEDPELRIIHLRPMGSSQTNILVGRVRWGRGKYFMGSAWYYVLASAVYRMFERPFVIGGLALFYGYIKAALTGHHRYRNPKHSRYLRAFERRQLLVGKERALIQEDARVRHRAGVSHQVVETV